MTDEKHNTATGEFQDPLENYDSPAYDDPLEHALIEETVSAIRHEPFATIPPDTPVQRAMATLASLRIGCLLVAEGEHLVGVFSNRDVLVKVADEYEQPKDQPVSQFMTADPVYVYDTDSSAAALCVMAVSGYRHVPVLDMDQAIVGIVSPQRVTAFLQKHFE